MTGLIPGPGSHKKMVKNLIVTGANGQLGYALCELLSVNGLNVIGVDKTSNKEATKWNFYKLDVTKEADVELFFEELDFPIDVLINNAGIGVFSDSLQRTADEFMEVLSVNLLGVMLMTNNYIKHNKRDEGHVINMGSVYGHRSSDYRIYGESGRNNSEVYTASKAGVIAMTKYYAANYSQMGFRFNSVSPGGVKRAQLNTFIDAYNKKTPMGRMANCTEIVEFIRYIAVDSPKYLNGADLLIDGGYTSW